MEGKAPDFEILRSFEYFAGPRALERRDKVGVFVVVVAVDVV